MNKREAILVCLVGPAGGGKTTLADKLLAHFRGSLKVSISATSRDKRPDEKDGESYYFLTRQEFEKRISNDQFFEWEENHGNLYGTLKSTVEQARNGDSDLLLVIDIRGALTVKKNFPNNTIIIFLTPPSYKELVTRLDTRGNLSPEDRTRRLKTTEQEFQLLKNDHKNDRLIDYLVINDQIKNAEVESISIIEAERLRLNRIKESVICELTDISE